MATLIQEAAAARAQSRLLRGEMAELRLALRRSAGHLEQRRTALESLGHARDRRGDPLPSPWSGLLWSHDHRLLADVLVPLP